MFFRQDHTYSEMRKNATLQWLNEMRESENIVNRDGAKVALEHIEALNKQIKELEDRNALKDEFLKRLKNKSMG